MLQVLARSQPTVTACTILLYTEYYNAFMNLYLSKTNYVLYYSLALNSMEIGQMNIYIAEATNECRHHSKSLSSHVLERYIKYSSRIMGTNIHCILCNQCV